MVNLMLGDCLERMKEIPDASVDMVLADPPYGTTACKWDSVIPFEPMWEQYRRVAKRNAAIVLTASQPFTTSLIGSNMRDFRYDIVWRKVRVTGHLNAKKMPLRNTKASTVFYRKLPTYNPQMTPKRYPYSRATRQESRSNHRLRIVLDDSSGQNAASEYYPINDRVPFRHAAGPPHTKARRSNGIPDSLKPTPTRD